MRAVAVNEKHALATVTYSSATSLSPGRRAFSLSRAAPPDVAGYCADASGGADSMTREHWQTAFLPLLYGVGGAIVLIFFLRETGRAAPAPVLATARETA